MKKYKRNNRRLTDKQLWFIWKTIQELNGFLNNQIESGAIGVIKDSDNGVRAMDLIQQQRRYLRKLKS